MKQTAALKARWADMARKSRWGVQPEPPRALAPEVTDTWVYGRLSAENSRSEDSIETQVDYCKQYIASRSDLEYKGSFEDRGFTGTNFKRPGFGEMMAAVLSGEIKCIVVKDLSRLGRTYIEVGELLFDTFLQLGVRFISVNDGYDSFAPDAGRKKLLILVKNLRNSQYSKDISQKIKSSVTIKQKIGIPHGGMPPYGYRLTTD
jgi:DNA invertase Pin-like site-specific DNA recombinase